MNLDLNCDLGEGEPITRTHALMRWITSANIACGGHAGDAKSMQECVRLAKRFGVHVGAHPGPWSRGDFGRSFVKLSPSEFELLLLQQVGALEKIARESGARLHHIKLHGALYHASETDEKIGRQYIASVARWWPRAIIYAKAGGNIARLAHRARLRVWEEGFADRGYQDSGVLVPRGAVGDLVTSIPAVLQRLRTILEEHEVETISGSRVSMRPQTLCVHGDSLNSTGVARAIRQVLRAKSH